MEPTRHVYYYNPSTLYQSAVDDNMMIDADEAAKRTDLSIGYLVVFKFFMSEVLYVGRVIQWDAKTCKVVVCGSSDPPSEPRGTIVTADRAFMTAALANPDSTATDRICYTLPSADPLETMTTGKLLEWASIRELQTFPIAEPTPASGSKRKQTPLSLKRDALLWIAGGMMHKTVAEKLDVSRSVVKSWVSRWRHSKTLSSGRPLGRPKQYDAAFEERLKKLLRESPNTTQREIAEKLNMNHRTVGYYVRRLNLRVVRQQRQAIAKPTVTDACRAYMYKLSAVHWNTRVYEDEVSVKINNMRFRIYLAIRHDGMACPSRVSIEDDENDGEFMAFFNNNLLPALKGGETLIWDRLGMRGVAKNGPNKFHYNPAIQTALTGKHCSLLMLPPHHKMFNPAFGLAMLVKQKLVADDVSDCGGLAALVDKIVDAVPPERFGRWFADRADGQFFRKYHPEIAF